MTKKQKENYRPINEPFEAVLEARENWSPVIYPEVDSSGLDEEFDGLSEIVLDYPGIWVIKVQRMIWHELTNQSGSEELIINGMYYDILEKKCIYSADKERTK